MPAWVIARTTPQGTTYYGGRSLGGLATRWEDNPAHAETWTDKRKATRMLAKLGQRYAVRLVATATPIPNIVRDVGENNV